MVSCRIMLIRSVACVCVGVGFVALFCNRTGGKQVEAMQAFDTKRRKQSEIEAGIVKFNQKPKDGLAYLVRESTQPLDIGSLLLAALVPVVSVCVFSCACAAVQVEHTWLTPFLLLLLSLFGPDVFFLCAP